MNHAEEVRRPSFIARPQAPEWQPEAHRAARSRLIRAVDDGSYGDLDGLFRTALNDPERFWRHVVQDLDIHFDTPFSRVIDSSEGKEFPRWFVDGRLNAARLCAHRHAEGNLSGKNAVVYEGDGGQRRLLTFGELDEAVRRLAANLVAMGIERGDRVLLFLPVIPEATVAFLAVAMIGAINVPAFSGYGPDALSARIADSGAVAIMTVDGTTRRGKTVPMKETADAAISSLDGGAIERVIVVRHLGIDVTMESRRDVYFDELDQHPRPVETASMDANDPLCIIYTSGTTGRPKGVVLSHGGFAVKAAVDFAYGFDIHADDVIGWISDMGWLLGPLMIMGGLQLGATVVFIEGVPTYPDNRRLFDIIERNRITMQGVAPTAVRALLASQVSNFGDLSSLRSFASTGEAWDDPTWMWLFHEVGGGQLPIINFTGGTEVGGGLLISYPFLPSDAAAFNGPLPGVDAAVFAPDGAPRTGQMGELVIRNTFPGMTHAFWQDRTRYLETYWGEWHGVWQHGDLASVDESGTWRIHGRSDDTIKVSGRRVGPAEIETALLRDDRIAEAAAIGVPDPARGQRVVAFVVLRDDQSADDDLITTAERNVGRAFAPSIELVSGLPKTKNGKVMRRAIRARHLGTPIGDTSALDPATPLEAIPPLAHFPA